MKRKKLRAYLSGGMEYAKREGSDWRKESQLWIESNLGHSVFNPTEKSKQLLARHLPNGNFRKLKTVNLDQFQKLVSKVVDLDSSEIAYRSDYVVCYWDKSAQMGAGTKGELTIAKFFGKPVFLVTQMKQSNIPGWVLGCTTRIFLSFSDLNKFLVKTYNHR